MYSVWIWTFSGGRPVMRIGVLVRRALPLRGRPDFAAIGAHIGDAVQRLHGRMRQIGRFVDRFDLLGGAGQRGRGIAILARPTAPGCCEQPNRFLPIAALLTLAVLPSSHWIVSALARLASRSRCCRRSRPRRSKS